MVIAIMAVLVVPVVLGGVGLAVMLVGRVFGADLSPGAILALAALPTAYLTWRLYRIAITPDTPAY